MEIVINEIINCFLIQAQVAYKVVTNKELTLDELQAIIASKRGDYPNMVMILVQVCLLNLAISFIPYMTLRF